MFDEAGGPDPNILTSMTDCVAHRGPDDAGIYVDAPVGLAHRRLSIIDPCGGGQPIFNEDGSISVVFNGEIYNHRELRADLRGAGHHFDTDADTEVLVHAYEEYGMDFVKRVEGMFAFALWDSNTEQLALARDPVGIKPLFVTRDGGTVAFASELPALLKSDIDHGGIRREAIARYFMFGFIPSPLTAFTNIERLRPGERLTVTTDDVSRDQYATPTVQCRNPSIKAVAADVRELVESAVDNRLMSDVPLGAFLSGGIDSSIIVGVMADLLNEPVQTFTVGFNEDLFDESMAARHVADLHETDHHEFTVTPDNVQDTIPDVLDKLGEPFADPSLIPTSIVARKTSQDVKVALSGDGADELFAGYDRYRGEYLSKYYRTVPSPLRSRIIEPLVDRLPASRDGEFGEFARRVKKFTRGGESNPITRHQEWLRLPDDRAIDSVASINTLHHAQTTLMSEHERVRTILPPDRQRPIERMLAVDTMFGLPNQMLRKVDRASMFHSLEVRVPFLDTDIVEYALSLPLKQKITAKERKRVLKQAFDDILPEPILKRDKQGFDMPIGEWLKGSIGSEFRNMLHDVDAPYVDTEEVLDIYDEHCHGPRDHAKFCWSVYVYLRWIRRMQEAEYL